MTIKQFKENLLHNLPRPIALQLYLLRNGEQVIQSKAYSDYTFELGVPKRNTLWIERLQKKNGHEPAICKWFEDHLRDNDVYIDVGSAFGFFPALISKMNPKVQIHGFEAGWQQYYFLERNAQRFQSINPWTINNKYVGNENNAQVVRLDDYSKKHKIHPTVIQIDVDGAENMVLSGAVEIIKQEKTEFLLELHPLILGDFGTSSEEVLSYFKEGYDMKILADLRNNNMNWSSDLSLIETDDNPYLYIYPKNKGRF